MAQYFAADRKARIEYAKQNLSKKTIIEYQNLIGKAMLQKDPTPVTEFAGVNKRLTELKIKNPMNRSLVLFEKMV